jgi:hypothetical protein
MKSRALPFLVLVSLLALPLAVLAHTGGDYYAPEILDKPLGITRLPNGNTLITDTGGANYTTTDSGILEVDPSGSIVWLYVEPLAFAHSANPWPDGTYLVTDTGNDRLLRVNREGQIVWTSEDWGGGAGSLSDGSHLDYPNDAEHLENGDILLSDRNNDRVLEVTEAGEIVWSYTQLVRPHNPDRLANGNTMISDSERNTVIEVDPAGVTVWQFGGDGVLNWPRDADRLENGNTLVTDSRNNRVIEVTPEGGIVWEYGGLSIPYEADRLPNGNTLISDNNHKRVIEVSPDKEIVWQFRNFMDDYPESLQNGGFETDADNDGVPDGWYPADLNAEGPATFLWDGEVRRGGQRSGGLEYHGPGRVAWFQILTVTPGEKYSFSGDIKTDIIGGVASYQIWFVDELGGPIGEPVTVKAHGATEDWTRDTAEVTAPAEARAAQIWALSLADGRVWFDNVSFGPPGAGEVWLWVGLGAGVLAAISVGAWVVLRRRKA